jgi:hypothetical protein
MPPRLKQQTDADADAPPPVNLIAEESRGKPLGNTGVTSAHNMRVE